MRRMVWALVVFLGTAAWAAEVRVVNAGTGGQNSAEGRARFAQDVMKEKPSVVLLYFGVNDLANEPKFLPVEAYVANMAWMIDEARAHGIVPVVSTIQHVDVAQVMTRHKPESFGAEGVNGKVDRYNRALLAMLLEKRVIVSDFSRKLDEAGGPTKELSADGTHLTAKGYGLLAETFFRAMPRTVTGTVVCFGDSLTYGVPWRTKEHDSPDTYPAQLEAMLDSAR
jgi:lysophospholipase L1-like esterase